MSRTATIHPNAAVDPTAELGNDVEIGAFAIVEHDVRIGDGCRLAAHSVVRAGSSLGAGVCVDSFCVIGGPPQMRSECMPSGHVQVGERTILREGVTVNQPTRPGGATEVGADCYLMANCHIGHDSIVGNSVTVANNVMLAGHVAIGDFVFLGGGAGVHQFVRIGEGAMIGGNASISYDVPPFSMAAERNGIRGLNLVGIRRRGMTAAAVADLKRCFHEVFRGGNARERAAGARAGTECGHEPEGRRFLEFFAGGSRGFVQRRDPDGRN